MKKKSGNRIQNGSATPRFGTKLPTESFNNNESAVSEVQSNLRRSTRRATIERRVWYPPLKEKFCTLRKYANRGRPRGSKSAYVKWKESQKRRNGCGTNFRRKAIVSSQLSKSSTQHGGKFPSLSNGTYLLGKLEREEVIVENEVVSLQSVITDEVVTDSYADDTCDELEISKLNREKEVEEPNATYSNKSSKEVENVSESSSKYKLNNKFKNLSLTSSLIIPMNLSEQKITSGKQTKGVELKTEGLNENVGNDDTHWSLDDALAELVDLGHANENETVTIHPVFNYTKVPTEIAHIQTKDEVVPLNLIVDKATESMIAGQKEENGSITNKSDDNTILSDSNIDFNSQMDSENICSSREESMGSEGWNQSLSRYRLSSKPPGIRTPLKCSECPMRFCTVRSLLWHFGTHLNLRSKRDAPIILEDLVAAWDTPDKPIKVDDKKNYDYKTEQKWPWSDDFSVLSRSDCPEDLSLGKDLENNFVGMNGEVILKVPAISKITNICAPSTNSHLRDILTSGKAKNSTQYEPLMNCLYLRENISCDVTKFNGELTPNSKQLTNFMPPTSVHTTTQMTPTISMCSSTLDTYSTDANMRLLSCVSNTLNKIDTTDTTEHVSSQEMYKNVIKTDGICNIADSNETLHGDDNLVRINDDLALRIVSTATTVGELTISVTNSCEISKKANQSSNTVSIFPQPRLCSDLSKSPYSPDILTIVPQNEAMQSSNEVSTVPHIITATGKLTPDASRVVNLILNAKDSTRRECDTTDDSGEESDCGMVIDVKDDENSMDPLSLCSVSLDEETSHPKGHLSSKDSRTEATMENEGKSQRLISKTDDEMYKRRKYVCQYCQKRFGWSTDLKRHIILHTGERPFKCKWCPITFTRKFLLQNHMRKMHPQICRWSDLWE